MFKWLPKSPFTLWSNIIIGLVGLILLGLIFWFIFVRPGQEHANAVRNQANAEFSAGRTQSGQDATSAILANNDVEKQDDQITQAGNEGIRAAAGSDDQISQRSNCARIRAQCMQRSRNGSESCRTLLESCTALGY